LLAAFSRIVLPVLAALLVGACASAKTPAVAVATLTVTPEPAASATATPSPTPRPEVPRRLVVAFTGDLMLDRDIETAMATKGATFPFEATTLLFEGVDYAVGNLEGTFTDLGVPMDKKYVFATDPSLATGLAEIPFRVVSLANNHATDYGIEGLVRTIETLDEHGIGWFGAGRSEEEARQGLVVTGEGPQPAIGYLGYNAFPEVIWADGARGGIARASIMAVREDVTRMRARPDVDVVVVTLHAGDEYRHTVNDEQRSLARAAIEAGADLVIGHHPHVLQPVEVYRDRFIFYSLGNFVFDLDADDLATLGPGPFQSVVVVATFEVGRLPAIELRPAMIDLHENRPRPATAKEASAILGVLGWPPLR
jgi:poly-gamma-glutamate capsule biosynthesis protein CapA/YwtB (metallophosphatase superfamily)